LILYYRQLVTLKRAWNHNSYKAGKPWLIGMDINEAMNQFLNRIKHYAKKTMAYFQSLPDKDPLAVYAWGVIGLGVVLVVVSFFL
jgi:hypothetical protein